MIGASRPARVDEVVVNDLLHPLHEQFVEALWRWAAQTKEDRGIVYHTLEFRPDCPRDVRD
jgi:hypothetical protein